MLHFFSVKNGRRDNRPSAQGQAPWAQDKDTSSYKQPNNAYGAGLIVPIVASKENAIVARQPSMKPSGRQEAPWASDDSEPSQAPPALPKKDAPWAQDDESSVYGKPKNGYGAGVRVASEAPVNAAQARRVPKDPHDAPWAKNNDPSVYMKADNGYGAGLDVSEARPSVVQIPRRAPRAQEQEAPWAQDHDEAVYRPAVNAYGVGVQAGAAPQNAQHGRRAANRAADNVANSEGLSAYMAPVNGYGAAQEDGGLQAHLDAKQSARAIRSKMSGAGNVLSWS